jgi:DNA-binding response OmpR family regulator
MSTAARAMRVLVVDDYPDAIETTSMLLKLDGHEVETANDGIQGVAGAAAFRPDLVLLDIGLPPLDGYAVARQIQALRYQPRPFIAAVIGHGMQEDKCRSGDAGIDLHLCKPVDPEIYRGLVALLQTCSDRINASRMLARQHRETATELMFRQLEMANIYLDTAETTAFRKEQCVVLATQAYERLITWLDSGACIDDRAVALVSGLRGLNERLQLLKEAYSGKDNRMQPTVRIRRQGSR